MIAADYRNFTSFEELLSLEMFRLVERFYIVNNLSSCRSFQYGLTALKEQRVGRSMLTPRKHSTYCIILQVFMRILLEIHANIQDG